MNRILPLLVLLTALFFNTPDGYPQRLSKHAAGELAEKEYVRQQSLQRSVAEHHWTQKQVSFGNYQMKFEYRVLGAKPADGRSLYISLHGGGDTTPKANDQ